MRDEAEYSTTATLHVKHVRPFFYSRSQVISESLTYVYEHTELIFEDTEEANLTCLSNVITNQT